VLPLALCNIHLYHLHKEQTLISVHAPCAAARLGHTVTCIHMPLNNDWFSHDDRASACKWWHTTFTNRVYLYNTTVHLLRHRICTTNTAHLTDCTTVSQQELHRSRVHRVDGLRHVNDVQLIFPPQQVVLAEVTVYQQAVSVHRLHILQRHS